MAKKNQKVESVLDKVSKDIIAIKFRPTMTIKQCNNEFYKIMRKHRIKQGTSHFNETGKKIGRTCNNPEWTMCKSLYLECLHGFLNFQDLFGGIPKDLLG